MDLFLTGDHKLLFLLPLSQNTKNVLILDIELMSLIQKLKSLGVDTHVGTTVRRYTETLDGDITKSDHSEISGIRNQYPEVQSLTGRFDMILLGRFPLKTVDITNGYFIGKPVINKVGYRRIVGQP